MSNLLVKYWKGWISSKTMTERGWWSIWHESALEAEKEKCELVVFKVPKREYLSRGQKDPVEAIERLLQEMYGS